MTVRVAVALLGIVTVALTMADAILITLPRAMAMPEVYGQRGIVGLFGLVSATIGGAVVLRHPRNAVGWILLISGALAPLSEAATEYASYALVERGGALPGGAWAAWLSQSALGLIVATASTYLLLVFPDGHLPSVRWRPVAWFTVLTVVVWTAVPALLITPVGFLPGLPVPNPVPLGLRVELDLTAQLRVATILLIPAVILCAAALVQRFRRSRGIERLQLKWVAYAGVISAAIWFLVPVSQGNKYLEIVKQIATMGVPVAAGIAILRYRLYDIDLLIKRTLVYGSLTAVLGFVYVVSVLISQRLLSDFTGASDIAVAGSTLIVVALFQPIRGRVQDLVDRRFYRARYDAARTIDAFSVRLRSDVDLDSVRSDLIGVIQDTIHPAHASVWLRSARR
jgi:hypothetical protein